MLSMGLMVFLHTLDQGNLPAATIRLNSVGADSHTVMSSKVELGVSL